MNEKNAVATQQQTTAIEIAIDNKFIDGLTTQLTQKENLGLVFPANYSVSNALNSAYLILQETKDRNDKPVLSGVCTKQSIASSLMDMTIQGLNPMKKQCYFVAMGGKLKLMRSYQGTMAVAKRCGVITVSAEVIYEGDTFKYHIENGVKYIDEHTQDFMNIDTNKIKGAYAVLTLEDGSTYTEIMNINQIKKAWSKGYGYKEGGGVHGDFGDQMAKKTVIGRACKNIINSSDDANLQEAFENTDNNEELNPVSEDMHKVIDMEANTEEFVMPEPEPEPKQETKKTAVKAEIVEPETSVFE
jgi:recombination protein RecT